jgi:hypothetical protein
LRAKREFFGFQRLQLPLLQLSLYWFPFLTGKLPSASHPLEQLLQRLSCPKHDTEAKPRGAGEGALIEVIALSEALLSNLLSKFRG